MTRCPTCQRTYEDESLRFCLDDGTPLVSGELAASTLPAITEVLPSSPQSNDPTLKQAFSPEPQLGDRIALPPTLHFGATPPARKRLSMWLITLPALLLIVGAGFGLFFVVRAIRGYGDEAQKPMKPTERGRILDRSGLPERSLAENLQDKSGQMARAYSLDMAMAHLLGSERGDPGLERALFDSQSGVKPGTDVRLTIDYNLQKAAAWQLADKRGAVVILNPQTGEVLAMYSSPSYSLKDAQDEAAWKRLEANIQDNPLLNRALRAHYIPGSTFTTVVMVAAHIAGMQDSEFTCGSGGYVAEPGAKPIFDDGGPSEVHGTIGIDTAYEVACNQYFAQLAVKIGPERLGRAAKLLGIGTYDISATAARSRQQSEIWNASTDSVKQALALLESTIVTGSQLNKYDLALEGFGQGHAGQMTPFQMALAASSIGNMEGKLIKPKIEFDRPPEAYNQVITSQNAAAMRRIMSLVTNGPRGTARAAFASVNAAGINAGGKTGTTQKEVPVYDAKTGEPKKVMKVVRGPKGKIIREYEAVVMSEMPRIDGWFLCIAPLDRPQIAMAVVIEGGGYGARSAAPVAAALLIEAKQLGLLQK